MINKIAISNFRCYQNSEIEGFKKINLIGRLNNVGKTVLLEAILLNSAPTFNNIIFLWALRGERDNKELPEYAWDSFFYQSKEADPIYIKANYDIDNQEVELIIEKNEEIDDFINTTEEKQISLFDN